MNTLLFIIILALLQASRGYSDISVSTLTPAQGITFTSQTSSAKFGSSVKNAGDFNGDGYDDIIIGSYGANGNNGAAYVIFGTPTGLSDLDISSGLGANQGVTILGTSGGGRLGYSVSGAGDINGDGIDDIIIGADQYNGGRGAAYVLYGSETPPAVINLAAGLDLSKGFAVTGGAALNNLGVSVSYAGDVNNDNIDDVIIGVSGVSSYKGAAYVIFGKKGTRNHMDMGSVLNPSDGFAILGTLSSGTLGTSMSSAGDIDGDGIGDLIIGAPTKATIYVIYGKMGGFGTIDLSQGLNPSAGFTMRGTSTSSQFGCSVTNIGDFNGDGKMDVLVGSFNDNSKGAAYVIFGNDRSALLDISLSSRSLDPARGIKIAGTNSMERLGWSVSGAGDINNDGIYDVIVAASQGSGTAGTAYVIFGSKSFGSSQIVPGNGLGPNEGFGILGDQPGDSLGYSVSYAGDMNGDGMDDIIVGASWVNSGIGAAYLLFSEPKSSLETVAEVSKGLFDSGSTASRIFTIGRSLPIGLGLIAKIIQNVRFLDIDYPTETLNAFKIYGTDLFELPIPEMFYESPETKELPSQYTRYGMEPSFLENYWDTIMTMLICLACFLAIKLLQFLTKRQDKKSLFQVALKDMGQTSANFFIIQIYSNLDDVIFYLLLDIQSTKLSSPSAGISLGAGILFLLCGLALVFFHCWLLGKYQQAKSQGVLERFENKYRILGTLYEDFKDDSIAKHSFFGILILRCVILILVIMLLQPQWMQGTLLMITNLMFLGYFIYYRPFKSLFDEISQYFCEVTVFAAYLCVLILSILDAENIEKSSLRNGLGKCIVIAGIVLALGGFIIQMIQTIGVIIGIYKFFKNHSKKDLQVEKLDQSTVNKLSENSAILRHGSPEHVSDQLGLLRTSHNNRRISPENRRQNDPEISSFNLDDSNFQNNRHTGNVGNHLNMPKIEEISRGIAGGHSKLDVVLGPLGSQIHREGGSSVGPLQSNNQVVRRKKIKRNAIRPHLSGLDDNSIKKM